MELAEIVPGEAPQAAALFPVHGGLRGSEISSCAAFYLDEAQNVAFPGDQVQVTGRASRPPAMRHDRKTLFPQIEQRCFFSGSARLQMLGLPGSRPA